MDRTQLSPLDRMKHSLFRHKDDSEPALPRKRRMSDIFHLPARIKSNSSPHGDYPSSDAIMSDGGIAVPVRPSAGVAQLSSSLPAHDDVFARSPDRLDSLHPASDAGAMDEQAMRRRLMDLESSFMPDRSAFYEHYERPQSSQTQQWIEQSSRTPEQVADVYGVGDGHRARSAQRSAFSDKTRSRTPTRGHYSEPHSSSKVSLRQLLSSPTDAAAQRNRLRQSSRNFKAESPKRDEEESFSLHRPQVSLMQEEQAQDFSEPVQTAEWEGDTQNDESLSEAQPELQPQPNTDWSQRSSMSSAPTGLTTDVEQNGIDSPYSRRTVRASQDLSRLPSFSSMASSISASNQDTFGGSMRRLGPHVNLVRRSRSNLERLVEEEKQKSLSPTTPRAPTTLEAPTNTVLTKHVQDIKVPDTVRRDFTSNTQKSSDGSTPFAGRPRTNLTLKEQNSRIDKLGKENFDLKLKIHYLHQALQDRSDEGVKDMISKNAQLQADLVKSRKESQTLRKRIRELEKGQRENNTGTRSHHDGSEDELSYQSSLHAQYEEEIIYLKEQIGHLEDSNKQMRDELLSKEVEKRNLADQVLNLTHADNGRMSEVGAAAYQQLIDSEVRRREAAEARERELLDEVARLANGQQATLPIHNAYGSRNVESHYDTGSWTGTTVVEQLRTENAELQRALGAQTSMLTSRNKERERLQQEIEDLKLVQRRGEQPRSNAGDSLFDRSVSRANQRPNSRHSNTTKVTQLSDPDREQYENVQANLRDENAVLKMRNQDLQKEVNSLKDSVQLLETELAEAEARAEDDRLEAQNLIDQLEDIVDERQQDLDQLQIDFEAGERDASKLRVENESMSERLGRLLGNAESTQATVENLRQDLNIARGSLETTEKALREATSAKERLEVQAESSQNEISFLREEQESDKIRISELQSSLKSAKTNLRDEKERLQELEDLESAATKAREEARRLKKTLTSKEVELASSNDRLEELDGSLRKALGVNDGTIQSLVKEVIKQQRDLENTLRDLDLANEQQSQREKQAAERDALLESSGLEARRLAEQLHREKQARRHDQNAFDKWQRTLGADSSRQSKQKLAQLEQQYSTQLRERNDLLYSLWIRLADLCDPLWVASRETTITDSIARDLPMAKKHILDALESVEKSLSTSQDGIRATRQELQEKQQALEAALDLRSKRVAELEELVASSTHRRASPGTSIDQDEIVRMRDEVKRLRREIKALKQDSLALPGSGVAHEEYENLKYDSMRDKPRLAPQEDLQRLFAKKSHTHLSAAADTRSSSRGSSQTISDTQQDSQRSRDRMRDSSALQRHASSSRVLDVSSSQHSTSTVQLGHPTASKGVPSTLLPSEQVWFLRLREVHRRLKDEREGRERDRTGAVNRLQEQAAENEDLRQALERERQLARLQYREQKRVEGGQQSIKGRAMVSEAEVQTNGGERDAGRALSH